MATHPEPTASPAAASRVRPWASLGFRDFRLLWAASFLSTIDSQMRQFTNVWQVYELTGSPLKLGLTGLFQALPLFTLGLFAGAVADAVDRRKLLIASQAINLVIGLTLGLLTYTHHIQVWHIYIMTALTSTVNIFGQPARTSLIAGTVPKSHLLNAVTLNQMINQSALFFGPTLAGLIVAWAGPSATYFINAGLFIPALLGLWAMRAQGSGPTGRRTFSLSSIAEGLRFVSKTQILVALILLDTTATLFGSYRSLMPVFAKDILMVGPAGLGALASAPALGAVLGTASILVFGNIQRKGLLVLSTTFLYAIGVVGFGLSHWFGVSLVLAGAVGFMDSMGVSARQTTVQLLTPEHMRGRTTSITQMFAMGSPSLGYIVAGSMASLLSAPVALVLGGAVIATIAVLIAVRGEAVRAYRS